MPRPAADAVRRPLDVGYWPCWGGERMDWLTLPVLVVYVAGLTAWLLAALKLGMLLAPPVDNFLERLEQRVQQRAHPTAPPARPPRQP